MFGYAVLYTLQVVFSSLYATILPPSEVWRVMNFCTAVGIIVSVTVVCAHKRSSVKCDSPAGGISGWAGRVLCRAGPSHLVLHRLV